MCSMAIMQSCCCWQSVRQGSYFCAVYTIMYFSLLAMTTGMILRKESEYLKGNVSSPESSSFLESGTISPTSVHFNAMILVCSCIGIPCSLLLLYGLYKDRKILLIPWIIIVATCGVIDIAHSLYMFVMTIAFTPPILMLYTLNFFLISLNVYSLLCVISQYQEYLEGRGTAAHVFVYRCPLSSVRYVIQPPTTTATTSCVSSRRDATNNETKATPTQSPTTCHNPLILEKSPSGERRLSRKHVQFPDDSSPCQTQKPEVTTTEVSTKCSPKIEHNNTRTWLQPNDAITIVVSQSSPSSEEEHIHDSQ